MTVSTQVFWNIPTPQETIDLLTAKGNELLAEGKEIGEAVLTLNPENTQQVIVTRTWIDELTAQEWIAFVQMYNPASAAIIEADAATTMN
jgi:hypothetical protein